MDAKLLEILRCPVHPDGPELNWVGDFLICQVDGVGYRILDGIPDMLVEDSAPFETVVKELQQKGLALDGFKKVVAN